MMIVDPDRLIDISLPIHREMLLYPGDSPPTIRRVSSLDAGDPLTASELLVGCHIGTHVDAPAHFLAGGLTLGQLDRKHFIGPAIVMDLRPSRRILPHEIPAATLRRDHHFLIKTTNSDLLRTNVFERDYAYLAAETVEYLLTFDPLSIGFDYYSLDPPSDSDFPAHLAVAKKGLPAFVCLDLAAVSPGGYLFLAFPLRIPEVEGIPVRALLSPLS